jgi:hypothetical protein
MHGRRQFAEVAGNFPDECLYVLEMLGRIYGTDAEARERGLSLEQRLELHRQRSAPVMQELHNWLERQLADGKRNQTLDWAKPSRTCCGTGGP